VKNREESIFLYEEESLLLIFFKWGSREGGSGKEVGRERGDSEREGGWYFIFRGN